MGFNAAAVKNALQTAPLATDNPQNAQTRCEILMAIVQKARTEPVSDSRSDNEIMGYDDNGLPI